MEIYCCFLNFDKFENSYFTKENIINKIEKSDKNFFNINLNSMIENTLKTNK
jgi:hypothetical protein